MVLALRDGIAILEEDASEVRWIAEIERAVTTNLMNDAKCDPSGRLWAGTRPLDEVSPVGSLYRIDVDHSWTQMVDGLTIANGLGWSPDGTLMYYIDSPTRRVDVFDFDLKSGTLSRRRAFASIDDENEDVIPDGLCVDETGGVWVALWAGGAVRRFDSTGRCDVEIRLPVSNVTSCAFGGDDLTDLYITTAAMELTPEQRASQPHAGGLFRCRPGHRGVPTSRFAG